MSASSDDGGDLLQRLVELLDRSQRLAQLFPQVIRRLAQGVQHLFLAGGALLGLAQRFSAGDVHRAQRYQYWLPRLAMEPISMALMPSRWQISRAISLVMRSSGERPMNLSVCRIF